MTDEKPELRRRSRAGSSAECHFIESGLGVLAEHRLSRLEKNFGLSGGLVLIDVVTTCSTVFRRCEPVARLLRRLRLVAGLDGVLIGFAALPKRAGFPAARANRYP